MYLIMGSKYKKEFLTADNFSIFYWKDEVERKLVHKLFSDIFSKLYLTVFNRNFSLLSIARSLLALSFYFTVVPKAIKLILIFTVLDQS